MSLPFTWTNNADYKTWILKQRYYNILAIIIIVVITTIIRIMCHQ